MHMYMYILFDVHVHYLIWWELSVSFLQCTIHVFSVYMYVCVFVFQNDEKWINCFIIRCCGQTLLYFVM